MNSGVLNQHDAHRGAESKGEFLGMTGNSAWYLFGSSGASLLLVIVLWGMLGLSLLVCLLLGFILCGLSLVYVFALKNNKPAHYDTDFFESALVEAGVMSLAFGPSDKRPPNPFRSGVLAATVAIDASRKPATAPASRRRLEPSVCDREPSAPAEVSTVTRSTHSKPSRRTEEIPTVPFAAFERLQNELNTTSELLEEALAEREEEPV